MRKSPDRSAIDVRVAGHLGGLECLRRRGLSFYSRIGRIGQARLRELYPGMAREWGKLGGRPKKLGLKEIGGDSGSELQKGGKGAAL